MFACVLHVGALVVNVGVPVVGICVFPSLSLYFSLCMRRMCMHCICECVGVRVYVYVCWYVVCMCVSFSFLVYMIACFSVTDSLMRSEPDNRRPRVVFVMDPICWRFEDPVHKAIQRFRLVRTVQNRWRFRPITRHFM